MAEETQEKVSEKVSEKVEPFKLFSPRIQEAVQGLMFLGQLQKDYDFCGHTFTLRTLRPAERAAIAVAIKPWRETIAEPEVWANAQVAAALVSVDYQTDFCPQAGPDLESHIKARLRYLTNAETGWYGATIAFLYDRFLELEEEALKALQELQNLSSRNPAPSQPSPDSSETPGTSDDETSSGTPFSATFT